MIQKPNYQLLIDGAWTEGEDGQTITSQNPANGQDWATFVCASKADVARSITAARRVLNDPTWRDMTQTQREPIGVVGSNCLMERLDVSDGHKAWPSTCRGLLGGAESLRNCASIYARIRARASPVVQA